MTEGISSVGRARDLDDRDQRIRTRPTGPTIHRLHSSRPAGDAVATRRPSIGRRIVRAAARFFITVFIGVGATLAWQSYGDAVRERAVARVPALAWLLSTSTTKSPVVAATAPDPMPKLESLASGLDDMRRGVELLAAKQEQMAQNLAALQAIDEDIRQKMSSAPPLQQAAPVSQPKPVQSRVQPSSVSRSPSPNGSVSLSR
jgi:hypothetical protein